MTTLPPAVVRATGTIVGRLRAFRPERIILFGSFARGDARPDSDLDVLVVLPDSAAVTDETPVEMRLAVGPLDFDYDLFVTTPAELAWRGELVGCVEYPALREGVSIYQRCDSVSDGV
jgi:predicted nucleotidyltransferase